MTTSKYRSSVSTFPTNPGDYALPIIANIDYRHILSKSQRTEWTQHLSVTKGAPTCGYSTNMVALALRTNSALTSHTGDMTFISRFSARGALTMCGIALVTKPGHGN